MKPYSFFDEPPGATRRDRLIGQILALPRLLTLVVGVLIGIAIVIALQIWVR